MGMSFIPKFISATPVVSSKKPVNKTIIVDGDFMVVDGWLLRTDDVFPRDTQNAF